MSFQVSPGVRVREIDLTNVVPAVSTSIGGFAGAFNWGPVDQIVTIGSEKELASIFGTPDSNTFKYYYTAAGFLQYGDNLKVVRVATGNLNADTAGTGVLVKNRDDYDDGVTTTANWVAKYPGVLGNSLKVSICPSTAFSQSVVVSTTGTSLTIDDSGANVEDTFAVGSTVKSGSETVTVTEVNTSANTVTLSAAFDSDVSSGSVTVGWEYATSFDTAPDSNEVHIAVIDEDGSWTGVAGDVLETFEYVSTVVGAKKDDGTNNYYPTVVNDNSQYIWWGSAITLADVPVTESLSGGTDDNAPDVGEIQLGYDLFEDAETVDVNLLFAVPGANGGDDVTIANDLIAIAEARKDVVVFISPPIEDTVGTATPADDVLAFANQLTSSSYAVIDSTALKVYDKYNDVYRFIPAAGHVAGLCANTDVVADAWFSPAGFTRGQLLGVTKIAFNPKKADRDNLYKARVNPIVSFPGEGTVLFGDKTALSKPSAFDRINVRRLFITLEKAIATAAKFQLFEFNDEFTRAQFRNLVEPFLRDVQGRRGVTDFFVVCDETNNTGQVIDSNRFVADIYIKPARSINFITLNFIATRTGVEFSEIIGQ